jgi:hypothetical protein
MHYAYNAYIICYMYISIMHILSAIYADIYYIICMHILQIICIICLRLHTIRITRRYAATSSAQFNYTAKMRQKRLHKGLTCVRVPGTPSIRQHTLAYVNIRWLSQQVHERGRCGVEEYIESALAYTSLSLSLSLSIKYLLSLSLSP